jgi:hypothetical protein
MWGAIRARMDGGRSGLMHCGAFDSGRSLCIVHETLWRGECQVGSTPEVGAPDRCSCSQRLRILKRTSDRGDYRFRGLFGCSDRRADVGRRGTSVLLVASQSTGPAHLAPIRSLCQRWGADAGWDRGSLDSVCVAGRPYGRGVLWGHRGGLLLRAGAGGSC